MRSASRGSTLSLEPERERAGVEQSWDDEHADDEHADDEHADDEHADDERADDEHADDERADGERADGERADGERTGWVRAYSGEESESERRALDGLLAEALAARAEILALVGQERTAKARQLRALQRFEAKGYHRALGLSIADFAVDVGVARTKREAQDLLRTGKHLERAPGVAEAFEAGDVDWTKVRDVAPLLTPETEAVWLPRLATWTNAQLEARVREEQGLPPERRVSFRMSLAVGARFDQLADNVRRCADRPLTDDEVFEEILQRAMSGQTTRSVVVREPASEAEAEPSLDAERESESEGEVEGESLLETEAEAKVEVESEAVVVTASTDRLRPSTLVVIQRCEDCKRTTTEDRHGTVVVSDEDYELERCNSATLDVREGPGRVTRTIPPRIANQVLARDRFRCCVAGCTNRTWIALHHEGGRHVVGHDPAAMMVLCTFHHRELHRGHLRAETSDGTTRFFRRDGVELVAKGPTAELPHMGAPTARPHRGDVARHEVLA